MELIDTERQINWPALMIEHIRLCSFDNVQHSLPFGFILTQVLEAMGVPVENKRQVNKRDFFGKDVLVSCDYRIAGGPRPKNSKVRSLMAALDAAQTEIDTLVQKVEDLEKEKAALKKDLDTEREKTRNLLRQLVKNQPTLGASSSNPPPS